jgi:ATP-dependent Clp protease, protease subunit
MGGVQGQAIEVEITARQIMKIKERINELLAKHTGQSKTKIEKDTDRDFYMSPNEAKEYGVIDEIVKVNR